MFKTIFVSTVLVFLVVIALLFMTGIMYTLNEAEQVVITRFGKPIGETITTAGLKFKKPFVDAAHRFDKRILEWDGYPNQVPTKDKKYIWIDTTARWKIVDALKFYESVGTEQLAQSRLDDIMDSATRDVVTSHLLIEVVRNSNRILEEIVIDPEVGEDHLNEPLQEINNGRQYITGVILENIKEVVPQFGIEVIDIQIKRLNYVEEVREKVFQRMISERQKIAEMYKSEGEGEAANIGGQKDKELQRIESEAYKTAQKIRGDADAQAIEIYAEAHQKDPDFFRFLETLDTYKETIKDNSTLILTTDSELYHYLKSKE